MPKPPKTTPHSDIDGVHQDEELNVKVAARTGDSATELAEAKKKDVARPHHIEDEENKDDRTG